MERHHQPADVHPPSAFDAALADDTLAREAFERLSPIQRREYERWIDAPRREDTRERRVRKAIAMLREGVKHP
jgi:uncharacterized protein YdeI (YjbR/CyaY-like superfamily)